MGSFRQKIGEAGGTLFADFLASVFYFTLPLIYDIRLRGMRNYHASPSTLVTINHKRDLDILIITPNLHLRKTLFKNKLRLHFLGRDDLFEPGFLTMHFALNWPLGKTLHKINIGPLMKALRAHPISNLVHKRTNSLMRDVIQSNGTLKLGDTVRQETLEEFARQLGLVNIAEFGDISLREFLGYDYRRLHETLIDTGILKEGLSRKVRAHSLKTIESQLQAAADILDGGGICLLAPEGRLSPDGRFWPVKSGLYRLLSMTGVDVKILPVNATYDFMTRKKMRIYIGIGEEVTVPKGATKIELEKLVQKRIVSSGYVTMGQLGSECLLQKIKSGELYIDKAELSQHITERALILQKHGLYLDDRLTKPKQFDKRLKDFTNYCLSRRILETAPAETLMINADKVLNSHRTDFRQNPVQYSCNELHSLLEAYNLL
ncbi:MAG: hypothetical protein JW856_05305 [Dehalococcoidales bacterium]|nr:hypothetical protein [Dehalococcoidales bacterium]